jgi:hypothetical protein
VSKDGDATEGTEFVIAIGDALCLDFGQCAAALGRVTVWAPFAVNVMLALVRDAVVASFVRWLPAEMTEVAVLCLCYARDSEKLKEFLAGVDFRNVRIDVRSRIFEGLERRTVR